MQGVTFSRIGAVMHHLANPALAHELAADRRAAATAARTARTSGAAHAWAPARRRCP